MTTKILITGDRLKQHGYKVLGGEMSQLLETPVAAWPVSIADYLLDCADRWQYLLNRSNLHEAPVNECFQTLAGQLAKAQRGA